MKRIVLALMLLAAVPVVFAKDDDGGYMVIGPIRCSQFIEDQKKKDLGEVINMGWVGGYLTRYNYGVRDTYDVLGNSDIKGAMLWLESYCKANPLNDLSDGMVELIKELRPKRHRSRRDASR